MSGETSRGHRQADGGRGPAALGLGGWEEGRETARATEGCAFCLIISNHL